MDFKEKMELINEKSVIAYDCAQSLSYVLKDIEEMEIRANSVSGNRYLGLSNIFEQLVNIIKSDVNEIMELSL